MIKFKAILFLLVTIISIFTFFSLNSYVNAQDTPNITEFSLPVNNSYPSRIKNGPDNSLWFTEGNNDQNKIGKITSTGEITEFQLPNKYSYPQDIALGSDGNLWVTELGVNKIGRVTPQGNTTEFSIPTAESNPSGITSGSDSNIWFVERDVNKIGRITSEGTITEFSIPTSNTYPYYIASGSDGNLWFAEYFGNQIGRITPNGQITEFQVPTANSRPFGITLGPDNNIWFTEYLGNKIGKITPDGTITEFSIPTNNSVPYSITSGHDGNLWFSETNTNQIGKITPDGIISEFPLSASTTPQGITYGPDNNIWFVEWQANKIVRFDISNIHSPSQTPTPSPSPNIVLQDYKQNRNADGSSVPWATQQLYNLSSCPTMASDGCAITAFADVLASYKLANLPNGTSVDPGNLNNYFAQTPGTHSGCSIYFNTAGTSVNYTVLHNDFSWIPLQTRIQHIDEALNNGNLVIAGVGGHFIVLDKKADLPAADGSPDYYIADPYRYAPYATGDRTGKLLSQTYKSVDQLEGVLQVVVLANKAPSPGKSWVIVAHSPVKFLVTDPEGNQTGYDPNSNTNIQNIPDSSYGIQQGLIDDTGVQPPQPDILYYGQENPVPGEYKIEVVGTGKGEYKLDLGEATGPGQTSLQTVTGTAAIGKTDTYIVTAPSDESTSPTFTKEVTFDVLKADLKSLYDRGLIDNKGIYTSFSVEVDAAAKANNIQINLLRKPLTLAALKAFLDELKAQRGKHVKEDAYQILYNDVQSLIKNLQGNSESPTPTPGSNGGS